MCFVGVEFVGWIPDPWFLIYLEKVHHTKYNNDTKVYDTEGCFLPSKFEEIFNKYAKTCPNAMTYKEIICMTGTLHNVNNQHVSKEDIHFCTLCNVEVFWPTMYISNFSRYGQCIEIGRSFLFVIQFLF